MAGAEGFCETCRGSLELLVDVCPGCALPTGRSPPQGLCPACTRRPRPFTRAAAAFRYGEAVAQAILRLKHGGRRDLAAPLGVYLGHALARVLEPAARGFTLAPVPLHPRRLRSRGFNQALELLSSARNELLRENRIDGALLPVERELLVRLRDTPELGHAGPLERRERLHGAFAVNAGRAVEGRRVVLVDDVFTTGATLSECARTLLASGAAEVRALALARALPAGP